MTATTSPPAVATRSVLWRRRIQRHGWTVGIWLLLVVLVAWYTTLIPRFGSFQAATILTGGTAWILLGIAQAVVVIAGGLDLGVGGMLVLSSVTAARFMDGQPFGVIVVIAIAIVVAAAALNAFVGWIITVSRIPDIVVTLGSLYIFQGLALMMLPKVGGGTSGTFRWIFTGSENGIGANPWPALVVITIPVLIVAWWMAKTKSGLSLYAVGSDAEAAFLSGVRDARTKIIAFAVAGALAALAGFSSVSISGVGNPTTDGGVLTLSAVAAIVLGGVALTGGIGSVLAVVPAALILFFFNPILSALGVDPNRAQVIQGILIVLVMMVAGILEWRRIRRA